MSKLYPYAEKNRLNTPNTYMYTPFVGKDFFAAYATERANTLKTFTMCCKNAPIVHLSDKIQAHLESAQSILSNHPWEISSFDGFASLICSPAHNANSLVIPHVKQHFYTCTVLDSLLVENTNNHLESSILLEYIAEKFEIGKCLRDQYNKEDQSLGEKIQNPLPYAQFALLLGSYCFEHTDYKILNALLKVIDTLCSISEQIECNTKTSVYATVAVTIECAVVVKVLQEI